MRLLSTASFHSNLICIYDTLHYSPSLCEDQWLCSWSEQINAPQPGINTCSNGCPKTRTHIQRAGGRRWKKNTCTDTSMKPCLRHMWFMADFIQCLFNGRGKQCDSLNLFICRTRSSTWRKQHKCVILTLGKILGKTGLFLYSEEKTYEEIWSKWNWKYRNTAQRFLALLCFFLIFCYLFQQKVAQSD